MAQPVYALDLRDLMDAHYGVGRWTQRTGVGTGSDIGPVLADGISYLRKTFGRGKILIPPGSWLENTSPADLSGVYLEGAGSMASSIVYNNKSGAALTWTGLGGYTGGGMRGCSLMLESGLGNTNAYGILLRGNAVFQPDQTNWEDIYMSAVGASSHWWDGFHADGVARSSPQGIRVASLTNIQIFNCRNVGFYGSNIVQWIMNNIGVYTGTGPYTNTMFIVNKATHVYGMGINTLLNIGGDVIDVWINGQRYN